MSDINADINALVDRIWIDDGAFNPTTTLIEDVRKSDQYQVKDLLIQIEHTTKKHKDRNSLNVYTEQLDHLAHRVSMDDPFCDPPTEEEEKAAEEEEAQGMSRTKDERREWAKLPQGKLLVDACKELTEKFNSGAVTWSTFEEYRQLIVDIMEREASK